MSFLPTFSRQVRLLQCSLFSPGLDQRATNADDQKTLKDAGFDISPFIQKIDLYESIFENTISGSITLLESVGLPEMLPIVGVETIVLKFQIDTGEDTSTNGVETFAMIFRVSGLKHQTFPRHDFRLYTLQIVTPTFVDSVSRRISRAYDDVNCKDAVVGILHDLDVPDSQIVTLENTVGTVDAVIPNWTPLQAINYFSMLSLTEKTNESNFLFFQTLTGYHFASIASMILQSRSQTLPVFTVDEGVSVVTEVNDDSNRNSIMRVHQNQAFDLLMDIGGGTLRSRVVNFDFLARKFDHVDDSRYTTTFDKTTHLAKYPVYPKNFDLTVGNNVRLFTIPSNVWSSQSEYAKSIGGKITQTRLHDSIVMRNRQMKEIRHMETLLDMPGQPGLRAGSVVVVNYPSTRPLQETASINVPLKNEPTPFYSGPHLVTAVHHILLTKSPGSMEYRMNVKVNRDSFGAPLIGTDSTKE